MRKYFLEQRVSQLSECGSCDCIGVSVFHKVELSNRQESLEASIPNDPPPKGDY